VYPAAENPDLDQKALSSKLGELYRGLSLEERKPYDVRWCRLAYKQCCCWCAPAYNQAQTVAT
jgi:hypothetical protein